MQGESEDRWVITMADGKTLKGHFYEREGTSVKGMRMDDWQGPYSGRGRHGRGMEVRYVSGEMGEGEYYDDTRVGRWVWTELGGARTEGEYEWPGQKQGRWVTTQPDGTVSEEYWRFGRKLASAVVGARPPTPSLPHCILRH